MDLSNFDSVKASDEGAVMEVMDPTKGVPLTFMVGEEKKPVTITLLGMDSQKVRDKRNFEINKRLKVTARNRNTTTAEQNEEEGTSLLAFCTVAWSGMVLDGKPLECTKDNAALVYTRFPWLRSQVDEFVGDRANFLKA